MKDVQTAWKIIVPVQPKYINSEINPQFVSIVTPGEIIINIEINIEIEDFTGRLFFCVPYSMVEPIKEKLYSGIHGDKFETDHRWALMMKEVLKETRLNVVAEIGKLVVTFGELIHFEVGNVLNLGKSVSDELIVKVEGSPKFKGVPGYSKGNQAIKVTNIFE